MVCVAQMVRAPDCDSGGRGFEPRHSPHQKNTFFPNQKNGVIVQLEERLPCKQEVEGSTPSGSTIYSSRWIAAQSICC